MTWKNHVPTGLDFVVDAVSHGMTQTDAVALDAVLAAAETRIMGLIDTGDLTTANVVALEVEADVHARFGSYYPTVAVHRAGSAS